MVSTIILNGQSNLPCRQVQAYKAQEAEMTSKLSSNFAKILFVLIIGLVMAGKLPANAADSKTIQKNRQQDFQTVAIVNPDGVKSIWLIFRSIT